MSKPDADPIEPIPSHDMFGIFGEAVANIQFKQIIALFFMYLFVNSDVFTHRVLTNINGALDYGVLTTTGIVSQAIVLCIGFIIIDLLVRQEVL